MTRNSIVGTLAIGLSAALVIGFASPVQADAASSIDFTPSAVSDVAEVQAFNRVPVVESQAQVGAELAIDVPSVVPLGSLPVGHDGALVRVSVLEPTEMLAVLAAEKPILNVQTGVSASTTVLLPVVDGGVSLRATARTDVRIEVLASFRGDVNAPGSTNVLVEPVTRVLTDDGLGGTSVSATPLPVPVTGEGGVAATGVRAVYATLTVTVGAPDVLVIGGQSFPIEAGTTSVTTVVQPGRDGSVYTWLGTGTGSLRLDVRGWINEAPQDAASINVTGSYVPNETPEAQIATANAETAVPVQVGAPSDGQYTLALVSAAPNGSNTAVQLGLNNEGRTTGAIIDDTAGALTQLAFVPSHDTALSLGAGTTEVTIQPLGSYLGENAVAAGAPLLEATSPVPGTKLDLTDHGTFTFTGTVETPGASLSAVRIEANGAPVGNANVRYLGTDIVWSFTSSVPESGSYELTAIAESRARETGQTSVGLDITLPEADAVIPSEDTVIVAPYTYDGTPLVSSITDTEITMTAPPAFKPGSVIVSEASPTAPEGYLRRVEAINKTAEGWTVVTSTATITDAILQADEQDEVDLIAAGDTSLVEVDEPSEGDTEDVEVVDEGVAATEIYFGDDVDLTPLENTATNEENSPIPTTDAGSFLTSDAPNANARGFGVGTELRSSIKLHGDYTWKIGQPAKDTSKAGESAKKAAKAEIKAGGGLTVSGTAQVAVTLKVNLKISATWNWGFPNVVVDDFSTVLATDAKASLTAEAFLNVAGSGNVSRKVAEIKFAPITFAVGPVPVVITSSAGANLVADFKAQASVKTAVQIQQTQSYGFKYTTSGGFKPVNEGPKTTYKTPVFGKHGNVEVKGSIDAGFGPRFDFRMSLYDAAGPVFSMGARAGASANIAIDEGGTTAEVAIYLDLTSSGRVELKAPIIDRVVLSAELFSLSTRFTLADWSLPVDQAFPPAGDGEPSPEEPTPGGSAPNGAQFVQIAAGSGTSFGVTDSGHVYWWGRDFTFVSSDAEIRLVPSLLEGVTDAVQVDVNSSIAAIRTSSGQIYMMGVIAGLRRDENVPTLVDGLPLVSDVAVGSHHFVALDTEGGIWTWGASFAGELGHTLEQGQFFAPKRIPGIPPAKAISADAGGGGAVTEAGAVVVWGDNDAERSGDGQGVSGNDQNDNVAIPPTIVPGLENAVQIKTAPWSTLVLTADGTVYEWGDLPLVGLKSSPSVVPGLPAITDITSSEYTNLALSFGGEVYVWGSSSYGFLGNGGWGYPGLVEGLPAMASLSAGTQQVIGIGADGAAFAWGFNHLGQLGLGHMDRFVYMPERVVEPWNQ